MVGDNVEIGVYSLNKALALAESLELDLVEISPNASPPVCKILEYKKFLYEQKKREKALKAKSFKRITTWFTFLRVTSFALTSRAKPNWASRPNRTSTMGTSFPIQ